MRFWINFWRVVTFFLNVIFIGMTLVFFYLTFGEGNNQLNFMLFLQSLILTKLSWDRWYDPKNVELGRQAGYKWH